MGVDLLDVVLSDGQLLEVILPWMVADGEQLALPEALSAQLRAKQGQAPVDLHWTPASFRMAVLNTVRCVLHLLRPHYRGIAAAPYTPTGRGSGQKALHVSIYIA